MTGLLKFLSGKKTYFCAVAIGAISAARYLGYDVPDWLVLAVGSAFGISLRAAVAKINSLD